MSLFKVVFCAILLGVNTLLNVSAQSTSLSETVIVNAVVISNTVSPATPPPSPNPVTNNGVPLSNNESGTDSAVFRGQAYPGSTVLVLKNGLILHELPVFSDGTFEIPVRNIVPGTYTFSLQAKDGNGLRSSTVTYTIIINSNVVTEVNGIIIPPTITTDKTEVKLGDDIIFSGKSVPSSSVLLSIFVRNGIVKTVTANASGTWSYTLSTSGYDFGDYTAKARTKIGNDLTLYSNDISFKVGNINKVRGSSASLVNARCDLNNDGRVNLLDFSIMAFWYKRLGFPLKVDLNSDKRINLTDLSILAYCWTG